MDEHVACMHAYIYWQQYTQVVLYNTKLHLSGIMKEYGK